MAKAAGDSLIRAAHGHDDDLVHSFIPIRQRYLKIKFILFNVNHVCVQMKREPMIGHARVL